MIDQKAVVAEIDTIIDEYNMVRAKDPDHEYLTHMGIDRRKALLTTIESAIRRLSPPGSQYLRQLDITESGGSTSRIPMVAGILMSLRDDVDKGRTKNAIELIHADLFSDFLDMAQHLLDEGYKDPSAVIAGSVLEGHLRKLASKHGVSTDDPAGRPKKADTLNAENSKAGAYSKTYQKNVTAWLDLRNKAAHGHYGEYSKDQVSLLIQSIRDFVTRNPA